MRYIPIITAIIGVAIHALGLFDLIPHPTFMADLSMLVIDLSVFYGLIKKTRWGYYLAIILYLQQSIMQPYWAYHYHTSNSFIVHPAEHWVAPLLVICSFIILILNKNVFIRYLAPFKVGAGQCLMKDGFS